MMNEISLEEEKRFGELCNMAFNFARNNEFENLRIMIEAGLNVNLKTHRGDTLLMLAAYNNSLETAKMLLEKGAKVDEKNDKGYLDMAKLLVSNGANIDENNGLGMTPFSFAIMFGRKDVARYLMIHSKQSLFKKISFLILNLLKK